MGHRVHRHAGTHALKTLHDHALALLDAAGDDDVDTGLAAELHVPLLDDALGTNRQDERTLLVALHRDLRHHQPRLR